MLALQGYSRQPSERYGNTVNTQKLNTEQLWADWLREFAGTLTFPDEIVRIRRAEPRPQNHNFFRSGRNRVTS
jgi:hypothetical protein